MIDRIRWLGHGSFVIQGPPLIYINPWRVVRSTFHPDVILVSHDHYEHCSLADINKLRGPETTIIGNEAVAEQVEGGTVLRPWQSISVDQASIKAVPAYSPDDLRHPIEAGGLGFVISVKYFDVYYAGDTQEIPEMDYIRPDIAILPIDGQGTLTIQQAAEVINKMRPRWVIPSNWGTLPTAPTHLDVQMFKDLVGGRTEVIIPPQSR
jgi:L-ascorbate metabolism protein UlaG (beta-lactamase superfamily)